MLESGFRTNLIKELKVLFPGCLILFNDPRMIQGIPDILILHGKRWAALETKRFDKSKHQPNQPYYVELMNQMSFAAFINQNNRREVLDELQRSFAN